MQSFLLRDENDIALMRSLLQRVPRPNVVDFEERMLMADVRACTRLWQDENELAAFAYVDPFNNLWFEILPGRQTSQLENEIVAWGATVMYLRNAESGGQHTLDASCLADDEPRIKLFEEYGFVREEIRSLKYERSLTEPIEAAPLPEGFSLRSVRGEEEVEALVALHRAAFGTENMTVEERLAIMHAPGYESALDLLAVAPDGSLAAFCICGFEEPGIGYTDPIGTHPNYQRMGVSRALVSAGLRLLQEKGAIMARTGTSSENLPMQKLAERLGFACVAERLWFSKPIL
jgi:ribosomal protein S18 acetylase RimI-like enzyme